MSSTNTKRPRTRGGLVFIKNCSREGPGLLEIIAKERKASSRIIDLEAGDELPDPDSCRAVVILGGPASANDTTPLMSAELSFVRSILEKEVPYLGICLGMQILAKAAFASVYVHAIKEVGIMGPDRRPYTMALTDEGRNDPIFSGYDLGFPPVKPGATSVLPIFQLHGETVALTDTMNLPGEILATGLFCTNQAIRIGNRAWGIQGHVEVTKKMLESWLHKDSDLQSRDRIGFLKDFELMYSEYERAARMVFGNFLDMAEL